MKLFLALLMTVGSAASALDVSPLPVGWTYADTKPGSLEEKITGAQGAFTLTENGEAVATVLVFYVPGRSKLPPDADPKSWRETVFDDGQKFIVLHDETLKVRDRIRYLAHYSSDTGTENMLESLVIAERRVDRLILLRFENHRRVYQKYSPKVEQLLRGPIFP